MTEQTRGGASVGMDSEAIYDELKSYVNLGVLQYVLPAGRFGEEWILGCDGNIVKLTGNGEAVAFLTGASIVARTLAKRVGLRLAPRADVTGDLS